MLYHSSQSSHCRVLAKRHASVSLSPKMSVLGNEVPMPTINRKFIIQALEEANLRLDGRTPDTPRDIVVNLGENGQSYVEIGETKVIAQVTGDITKPYSDRPAEGFLNFYVEVTPIASPNFDQTRQNERAMEISRLVERGIRESRAIDTEALCILAEKKVWSIRVDIHVIDHQGNLIDAVNLAAVSALLHYRRPDVTVVGENVTVHATEEKAPVVLAMNHTPIAVTFVSIAGHFLIDPSLEEEECIESAITVIVNAHRELCALHKPGLASISQDMVLRLCGKAAQRAQFLTEVIRKKVQDASLRSAKAKSASYLHNVNELFDSR